MIIQRNESQPLYNGKTYEGKVEISALGKAAMDYKNIVKSGYDKVADRYLAEREVGAKDAENVRLLADFIELLSPKSRVLDAGCGAGVPITKMLAEQFDVIGVDFSGEQVERAKRNVPNAHFFCQDMTELDFPDDSLDGICSYYAIIHIPREEHAGILDGFFRLSRPGGLAFLCLGAMDIAEDFDDDYYGARMYWSHYDADTYLSLLRHTGFAVLWSEIISDSLGGEAATGGHLFVLAQKPSN